MGIKHSFVKRSSLCLLWLACLQPACAQTGNLLWHVGSFSAELSLDSEPTKVAVRCESQKVCEYLLQSPGQQASRSRADNIQPLDVMIPNNNLDHTREAVQSDPGLYDGPEGGLLKALRPLLDSKARYQRCVGVAEMDGPWGQICQLDKAGRGLPDAVLLLPTMNPTCNSRAFCAYYVIPLRRLADG